MDLLGWLTFVQLLIALVILFVWRKLYRLGKQRNEELASQSETYQKVANYELKKAVEIELRYKELKRRHKRREIEHRQEIDDLNEKMAKMCTDCWKTYNGEVER